MIVDLFNKGGMYYLRCAAKNGWINWKDVEGSVDCLQATSGHWLGRS